MLNWFRKKKKTEKIHLTFEYAPGQPFQCECRWPSGLTDEEYGPVVEDFGSVLLLLKTGNLLNLAQEAVALEGQRQNSPKVARSILYRLNQLLDNGKPQDVPVVPATECFRVRGGSVEND